MPGQEWAKIVPKLHDAVNVPLIDGKFKKTVSIPVHGISLLRISS
jgi:hypothetical protein